MCYLLLDPITSRSLRQLYVLIGVVLETKPFDILLICAAGLIPPHLTENPWGAFPCW
jgi:hypothetical protein